MENAAIRLLGLEPKEIHDQAQDIRPEYVIQVQGVVEPRPEGTVNPKMPTGEIEIVSDEFHIISESLTPPFEIEDETNARELLRLEYRYLDLRRKPLQEALRMRHQVTRAIRGRVMMI